MCILLNDDKVYLQLTSDRYRRATISIVYSFKTNYIERDIIKAILNICCLRSPLGFSILMSCGKLSKYLIVPLINNNKLL